MPNPENVVGKGRPFRTGDEQSKIASEGGKASGRSRRAKRDAREVARWVLELTPEMSDKAREGLNRFGATAKRLTVRELASIAIAQRAIQGDRNAYAYMLELAGEYQPGAVTADAPDVPVLIERRPDREPDHAD